MIDRAHALGLKVYGGTLNPLEGYPLPGFWTPLQEFTRERVACHASLPPIASRGADEFGQIAVEPLGSIDLHSVAHAVVHE